MALRRWCWILGALLCAGGLRAADPVHVVPAGLPAGQVRVGSRTAFVVEAPVGSISAAERADIVNRRVETILQSDGLDPHRIQVGQAADGSVAVVLGDLALIGVTPADALAAGAAPNELAAQWARVLREELVQVKPLYAKRGQIDIKTLSEHHVLLLILQVALLLLAARLGGEWAARRGQSPVIGQLLAGVILGPSVLGGLWPQARALLFPVEATQSYLLEVISWLGVLFLLLLAGLESDLAMMRAQGRAALATAVLGAAAPFVLGLWFGWRLPSDLLLSDDQRGLVAVFLGTALAVSSVPVIANILLDMGRLRGVVGQITLAAALAHDTVGWMVLAVVASLTSDGPFDLSAVLRTVLGTMVFVVVGLTSGRRMVAALLQWSNERARVDQAMLTAVVVLMLASAAITQAIGVHAVLGAFVIGMVLRGLPEVAERAVRPIEAVTMGVFAPVFFAAAGLNVSLELLADRRLLGLTLVFTLVATVGKVAGCYLGGRLVGLPHWPSLSVGLGANARGAMGLIVGILGFSLGLLTVDLFSMLILMALLTTAMTPPLLRWSLRHQPDQEPAPSDPLQGWAGARRLLVADWDGPGARLAVRLAEALATQSHLLVEPWRRDEAGLAQPTAQWAESLAGQLRPGDVAVLGAGDERGSSLCALARAALRAGHPLLLVQAGAEPAHWPPRRVLLPTKGVEHGLLAARVAVALAAHWQSALLSLHVLPHTQDEVFWLPDEDLAEVHARQMAALADSLATAHGLTLDLRWRAAQSRGQAIVQDAQTRGADLIVVGATPRPSDLLALGGTVGHVLRHAPCPVLVAVPPAVRTGLAT